MGDENSHPLVFKYTNWRGETAYRWATPISVRWGTSEWHPRPCWLMLAFDHDKGEEREFSLEDCLFEPIARFSGESR